MYKPTKLDTHKFKKDNPTQYSEIKEKYSPIFSMWVAIDMWMNDIPPPVCEMCGERIQVSHKMPKRCMKHINLGEKLLSYDDFITKVPKRDNISYSRWDGVKAETEKINVICSIHGERLKTIRQTLKHGCQKCNTDTYKGPKITTEEWIEKCKELHSDDYDYSKVDFLGSDNKVEIICPKHGSFYQTAIVHSTGHGCKKCADENNGILLSIDTVEFIKRANNTHGGKYQYPNTHYINSRSMVEIECKKHGSFNQIAYYHLTGNGCQKCGLEQSTYHSKYEYEIKEFIEDFGFEVIIGDRPFGFELDLVIPGRNIAIEFNGMYWHSSDDIKDDEKMSMKHVFKTNECENNGIHLFHIFENEWIYNKKIWKSIIKNSLNLNRRIMFEDTEVDFITVEEAEIFINSNSIEHWKEPNISMGLFHNGELVSVMTFKTTDGKNELLHYCDLIDHKVVGGFEKIIKEFRLKYGNEIIAYVDRRFENGSIYENNNFKLIDVSPPIYYYTDCKDIFQENDLSVVIEEYDTGKTEVENMYDNKFRRIWDSGHKCYRSE